MAARGRVLVGAGGLDSALFGAVARRHTPGLDRTLPPLSVAANNSKLWALIAAGLAARGGRRGQRAALRGLGSLAVTSALVNQGVKCVVRRPRPSLRHVPVARRLRAQPTTTSFPSGHAASAAAFAVGAGSELPRAALPLGALAAAVGYSRVYVGVHYPLDVAVGAAVGAGVALLSRLQWPVLPPEADVAPASDRPVRLEPRAAGRGLALVVNTESGSPLEDPLGGLEERLAEAEVVEVSDPAALEEALRAAARRCEVLGICGGDGSAVTAARVALEHDRPLLVIPAGTLNHLARDLRTDSSESALDCLERGEAAAVDVAEIDGQPFLNSASLGAYTRMLDARRSLESRIGRWPAHVVAVAKAVLRSRPIELELDGRRRRVWMAFVGNCRHEPAGFAPSWRPRLDDGLLDVRLLTGERPLARARLLLSILAGRLTRCAAYERFETPELQVRTPHTAGLDVGRDGERARVGSSFSLRKRPRALVAYAPLPERGE